MSDAASYFVGNTIHEINQDDVGNDEELYVDKIEEKVGISDKEFSANVLAGLSVKRDKKKYARKEGVFLWPDSSKANKGVKTYSIPGLLRIGSPGVPNRARIIELKFGD